MTDLTANDLASQAPKADGHGATDGGFLKIAIALAIITAIEVTWSYLPIWDGKHGIKMFAEIGGLLLMMMLKFVLVAGYFMHLKFDRPVLARIFYASFALAVVCYIAVLATFEVWSTGKPGFAP